MGQPPVAAGTQADTSTDAPVGIGIVGCGAISSTYIGYLVRRPDSRLVAFADLDPERAKRAAEQVPGARALDVDDLVADPDVEVVLNLTRPQEHVAVGVAALEHGRAVFSEKPMAVDLDDAQRLMAAAARTDGRLGCAPDSFLSPAFQACRRALDDGVIGTPVAVSAEMLCPGHEGWHPDPAFYYRHGGGPLLDMGPYYLTAMVALLGPVRRASAAATATWPTRTVTSAPRHGEVVDVEVPTHVSAVMEFAAGPIATLTTSFDVAASRAHLDIHGTAGSLRCPDPNTYGGPVLHRPGGGEWRELALPDLGVEVARGFSVAELGHAARAGRDARASGALAYHVLDVMTSILRAADSGDRVDLRSTCERPEPLPAVNG
jgi:predicted dehydrogenase